MNDVICISSSGDEEDESEKSKNNVRKRKVSLNSSQINNTPKRIKNSNIEKSYNNVYVKTSPGNTSANNKSKPLCVSPQPGTSGISNKSLSITPKNIVVCKIISSVSSNNSEKTPIKVIKPQLIVKDKVQIPGPSEDVFDNFVKICLQKKNDEATQKILANLRKHYDEISDVDKQNEVFKLSINTLLQKISQGNSNKFYYYIQGVKDEIKNRIKRPKKIDKIDDTKTTTEDDIEDEQEIELSKEEMIKVKKLQKVIKKCQEKIKELEEREVDFDEEEDSAYLQEDRYKRKLVELCVELNKIVKDKRLKQEIYKRQLRRKDISEEMTGISSVDEAIINLVNSGIKKMNKLKHIRNYKATAECLSMPDYQDILQCIIKHNNLKDLGLSKKKMEKLAEIAFKSVGRYLKKQRIYETQDYISSYADIQTDDPALKNIELNEKLQKNKKEGDQKLNEMFIKYVRKQEGLSEKELEEQVKCNSSSNESENELLDKQETNKHIVEKNEVNKNRNEGSMCSTTVENNEEKQNNTKELKNKSNFNSEVEEESVKIETVNNLNKNNINNEHVSKIIETKNNLCNTSSENNKVQLSDDDIEILSDSENTLNKSSTEIKSSTQSLVENADDLIKNNGTSAPNNKTLQKTETIVINKNVDINKEPLKESIIIIESETMDTEEIIEDTKQVDESKVISEEAESANISEIVKEKVKSADMLTKTTETVDSSKIKCKEIDIIINSEEKNDLPDLEKSNSSNNLETKSIVEPASVIHSESEIAKLDDHKSLNNKELEKVQDAASEESSTFIKVCSFAKPPDSWKDSPEKANQNLKKNLHEVLEDLKDPECIDLTSEKDNSKSVNNSQCINPLAVKICRVPNNNTTVIKSNVRNVNFISPADGIRKLKHPNSIDVQLTSPQVGKRILVRDGKRNLIVNTAVVKKLNQSSASTTDVIRRYNVNATLDKKNN